MSSSVYKLTQTSVCFCKDGTFTTFCSSDKGIIFIEHIYDYRNKQFFSFNEIHNLNNVPQTDFSINYQLTTCTPYQWKVKLKSEEIQYNAPEYLFEKLIPQLKTCRYIYNTILEKKTNTMYSN